MYNNGPRWGGDETRNHTNPNFNESTPQLPPSYTSHPQHTHRRAPPTTTGGHPPPHIPPPPPTNTAQVSHLNHNHMHHGHHPETTHPSIPSRTSSSSEQEFLQRNHHHHNPHMHPHTQNHSIGHSIPANPQQENGSVRGMNPLSNSTGASRPPLEGNSTHAMNQTNIPPTTASTSPSSQMKHILSHKLGCKCRKSFCLKKYCECYHHGVKCGTNCRCINCQNKVEEDGKGKKEGSTTSAITSTSEKMIRKTTGEGTKADGGNTARDMKANMSKIPSVAENNMGYTQSVPPHRFGEQIPTIATIQGNNGAKPPPNTATPYDPHHHQHPNPITATTATRYGAPLQDDNHHGGMRHYGHHEAYNSAHPNNPCAGNSSGLDPSALARSNQHNQSSRLTTTRNNNDLHSKGVGNISMDKDTSQHRDAQAASHLRSLEGNWHGAPWNNNMKPNPNGCGGPETALQQHHVIPQQHLQVQHQSQIDRTDSIDSNKLPPKNFGEFPSMGYGAFSLNKKDPHTDEKQSKISLNDGEDRMAIMAALAMTELCGTVKKNTGGQKVEVSSSLSSSMNMNRYSNSSSCEDSVIGTNTRPVSSSPETAMMSFGGNQQNHCGGADSEKGSCSHDGQVNTKRKFANDDTIHHQHNMYSAISNSADSEAEAYKKQRLSTSMGTTTGSYCEDEESSLRSNEHVMAVVSTSSSNLSSTESPIEQCTKDSIQTHSPKATAPSRPDSNASIPIMSRYDGQGFFRPNIQNHLYPQKNYPTQEAPQPPSQRTQNARQHQMPSMGEGLVGHHYQYLQHGSHTKPPLRGNRSVSPTDNAPNHNNTHQDLPQQMPVHSVKDDGNICNSNTPSDLTIPLPPNTGPIRKRIIETDGDTSYDHPILQAPMLDRPGTMILPKSLSFRKICSTCGKTRGEHGELGFGNKCVYQDCGRCGAGVHMHIKAGSPMGFLCVLTSDEGATPGMAEQYEKKIRDLAAMADLKREVQAQQHAQQNKQQSQGCNVDSISA